MEAKTKKEDQIFKIIDNILKQVFGEEATSSIYKYIEHNYAIRKKEFSKNIDIFAKGLEECLSSGALIIESKILEDLSTTYGFNKPRLEKELETHDFASQMRVLMQKA